MTTSLGFLRTSIRRLQGWFASGLPPNPLTQPTNAGGAGLLGWQRSE
jgi:hypothetical protein